MINLDDIKTIKSKDPLNVLGSIEQLGNQCKQAWEEINKISFPKEYFQVNKIVFSGMGGSALGAYVVKDLFFKELKIPFEIINDYHLPPFVDEKTLVILASYSGTTEETLNCAQEVLKNKNTSFIFTTNGQLAKIAKANNIKSYIYLPVHNPSKQPRLATGYSIFGQIALLNKLKLLKVSSKVIEEVITALNKGNKLYGIKTKIKINPAKKLASKLFGKIPIIVVAQHLNGVGRVIRNQLHESAKNFADYYPLPELNHHLMEGLRFPEQNTQSLAFLFLISQLYSDRILKRLKITQEVVKKNGIAVHPIYLQNQNNKIVESLTTIQFGAYLNYYLGILNKVDPAKIPWVDYFKAKLSQ